MKGRDGRTQAQKKILPEASKRYRGKGRWMSLEPLPKGGIEEGNTGW
jgi:hypothetical protein